MSHLRQSPLTKKWVIMATEPAKRPDQLRTTRGESLPRRTRPLAPSAQGMSMRLHLSYSAFRLLADSSKRLLPWRIAVVFLWSRWTVRFCITGVPTIPAAQERLIVFSSLLWQSECIGIRRTALHRRNKRVAILEQSSCYSDFGRKEDNESCHFCTSADSAWIVPSYRGCPPSTTRSGTCSTSGRRLRSVSNRSAHRGKRSATGSAATHSRPSNRRGSGGRRNRRVATGNTSRCFLDGRCRWRLLVLPPLHGESM